MVIWLRRSSHLEKVWLVSTKREDAAATTRESYGIKESAVVTLPIGKDLRLRKHNPHRQSPCAGFLCIAAHPQYRHRLPL